MTGERLAVCHSSPVNMHSKEIQIKESFSWEPPELQCCIVEFEWVLAKSSQPPQSLSHHYTGIHYWNQWLLPWGGGFQWRSGQPVWKEIVKLDSTLAWRDRHINTFRHTQEQIVWGHTHKKNTTGEDVQSRHRRRREVCDRKREPESKTHSSCNLQDKGR